MSSDELAKGLRAIDDEDVRSRVAAGEISAAGDLDLTDEEAGLLRGRPTTTPKWRVSPSTRSSSSTPSRSSRHTAKPSTMRGAVGPTGSPPCNRKFTAQRPPPGTPVTHFRPDAPFGMLPTSPL